MVLTYGFLVLRWFVVVVAVLVLLLLVLAVAAAVRHVRQPQLVILRFSQVLVLVLQPLQGNAEAVEVVHLLLLPLLLDYLLDLPLLLLGPPLVDLVHDELLQF